MKPGAGFLALVVLVSLCRQCHASGGGAAQQPNIVFIMADDLGWRDLSYNVAEGDTPLEFTTPIIDELALSGVRMPNYYVQKMCTPTRVALLTGRHPLESGMHQWVARNGGLEALPTDMELLPQRLKSLGYETFLSGKWHLGMSSLGDTPIARGFDDFLGNILGTKNYFTHDFDSIAYFGGCTCVNNSDFTTTTNNGYDLWSGSAASRTLTPIAEENVGIYDTDLYTDAIVERIQEHSDENPLFVWASYRAPHDPWQAPSEYADLPECAAIADDDRRQFCGMMKNLDDNIGRIVDTLEEEDLLDNTIIVFTSDNGAGVGETFAGSNWPLRGGKNSVYEGGSRVPAFIWGDAILPGSAHELRRSSGDGGQQRRRGSHDGDGRFSAIGDNRGRGRGRNVGGARDARRSAGSGKRRGRLLDCDFDDSESVSYPHVFNIADWFLTLSDAASATDGNGSPGVTGHGSPWVGPGFPGVGYDGGSPPDRIFGAEVDGTRHVSSVSHWSALKRLAQFPCGASQEVPPRGEDQLMMYSHEHAGLTSARNTHYKLSRDDARLNDGYWDASDRTREDRDTGAPPSVFMFKISEDPLEQNLIDVSNYTALSVEEQEAFDQLTAYIDYWDSIALAPQNVGPRYCDASPVFHDCYWAPWRNTDEDLAAGFELDTTLNCIANNGLADDFCPETQTDQWRNYA